MNNLLQNIPSSVGLFNNDALFSRLSFGNHRIWFHCGLSDFQYASNSMAKEFRPLAKIVNSKLTCYNDRKRFWAMLGKEEHHRLQKVYEKAVLAFGYDINKMYALQKSQVWAFATIAYDIHILGDLTTAEYKIVRSEKDVREDIFLAIRTLGGHTNKSKAEALISFLNKEAPLSDVGKGTNGSSAQKLLDALKDKKKGFSQFVLSCKGYGYNYKDRFRSAGLEVKN